MCVTNYLWALFFVFLSLFLPSFVWWKKKVLIRTTTIVRCSYFVCRGFLLELTCKYWRNTENSYNPSYFPPNFVTCVGIRYDPYEKTLLVCSCEIPRLSIFKPSAVKSVEIQFSTLYQFRRA